MVDIVVPGDVGIYAHIVGIINPDITTKVGIMVRENLTTGSPYIFAYIDKDWNIGISYRLTQGGVAEEVFAPTPTEDNALGRLGITRTGDLFKVHDSYSGSWRELFTVTIDIPVSPYIFIALTSTTTLASATLDLVFVNERVWAVQTLSDVFAYSVGSVPFQPNFTYNFDELLFEVSGSGLNIGGIADSFSGMYWKPGETDFVTSFLIPSEIGGGAVVNVPTKDITVLFNSPIVSTGKSVQPEPLEILTTLQVSVIEAGNNIEIENPIEISINFLAPNIKSGASVNVPILESTVTFNSCYINTGAVIDIPSINIISEFFNIVPVVLGASIQVPVFNIIINNKIPVLIGKAEDPKNLRVVAVTEEYITKVSSITKDLRIRHADQ